MTSDEQFFDAYVECALWSSLDDDDDPFDVNYARDAIHPATLDQMRLDCEAFLAANDIPEYGDSRYSDAEMAGHDFWLTRNGHGAGFWDGDLPEDVGNTLTQAANVFGEFDLYMSDDGMIHGS